MLTQFYSKQFLSFLLTGGIAAGVNFFSRFIYEQWFSFSSAVIVSYLTGMITAFVLAKAFVFRESEQRLSDSIMFFCAVNVLAILQTWVVSVGLALYIFPLFSINFYNKEIAHIIGIAIPVFTSYIGHKKWSFK